MYDNDNDNDWDGEEPALCESDAKIGTGNGVCLTRLDKNGNCPRADRHR